MAYPELRHPFEERPIHPEGDTTILYQGRATTLSETGNGDGLRIRPDDLARINSFELKPQGACFQDMCVPMNDQLLIEDGDRRWFDLAAFADRLDQPYVADTESRVWSFAEMPARRDNLLVQGKVPDFSVTDRQGNLVTPTHLKGRKALIVTWSSW